MTKREEKPVSDIAQILEQRLGALLGEFGSTLRDITTSLDRLDEAELSRAKDFTLGDRTLKADVRVRVGGLSATSEPATADEEPYTTTHEAPGQDSEAPSRRSRAEPDAPRAKETATETVKASQIRDIEATVLRAGTRWTLVADLPGAGEDDVALSEAPGQPSVLVLEANGRTRRYAGRFELPEGVSVADLRVRCTNGVLELSAEVATQ